MRTEDELRQLKAELDILTGFITDFGSQKEYKTRGMTFANDLSDCIAWVLEEISTSDLRGEGYLNIARLEAAAMAIEGRTGKKRTDSA